MSFTVFKLKTTVIILQIHISGENTYISFKIVVNSFNLEILPGYSLF